MFWSVSASIPCPTANNLEIMAEFYHNNTLQTEIMSNAFLKDKTKPYE